MTENLQPFEIQREAFAERLNLKEQWESQVKILNEVGILEILPESQELGIIGIDGQEYPVPDFQEIMSRITPEQMEVLEKKNEQGFNKMLITPFGMPLDILISRYKELLLKKDSESTLLATDGSKLDLDRNEPTWVWEGYNGADANGGLVYFPESFTQNHEGQTKQEILANSGAFKIEFIEDTPDMPRNEQTQGGRIKPTPGKKASQYLEIMQNDENMTNEHGLTPETWLTYAITNLKERNQQIDDWQGQGKGSWLTGAYFPASGFVPCADWDRDARLAYLDGSGPSVSFSGFGCRSSVEIK